MENVITRTTTYSYEDFEEMVFWHCKDCGTVCLEDYELDIEGEKALDDEGDLFPSFKRWSFTKDKIEEESI